MRDGGQAFTGNWGTSPSQVRQRGLATRLLAAAEAEAAARGCSQTVHFTHAFQARALYERNGYQLVGCVEDFPSGTDVLWYRKRLKGRAVRAGVRLGQAKSGRVGECSLPRRRGVQPRDGEQQVLVSELVSVDVGDEPPDRSV